MINKTKIVTENVFNRDRFRFEGNNKSRFDKRTLFPVSPETLDM